METHHWNIVIGLRGEMLKAMSTAYAIVKKPYDDIVERLHMCNVYCLAYLTPKVLGIFFIKTASKEPLFKARWILQTWGLF
jgi:hypothetical protein